MGSRSGYREATVNNEVTREGQVVVVAEHSTAGRVKEDLADRMGNQGRRDPFKGRRSRAYRSVEKKDERL